MSFDLRVKDGDLALGSNRDLATVENSEKLVQDVLKLISTPIGSNPFFPWYGSPIERSLIGTPFETNFIESIATQQLKSSLETLQNLQKEQLKQFQLVTPQEQIAAVQDITVQRNTIDPRFFRILITVLSKAFRQVQTSLTVRL